MSAVTLVAAHHARFGADPANVAKPELLSYWSERILPYGEPVRPDRYLTGNRNSLTDMSMHVVDRYRDGRPFDLVVTAHATPDCDPLISLTGSYARRHDDGALVFAVSDQGRLSPFTALRVAAVHPWRGRALVIALDQSSLVSTEPRPADLDPVTDHAVGLLLDRRVGMPLELVATLTEVAADDVAAAVRTALDGRGVDLLIAGPRVPSPAGHPVRRAASDQLCTAVWTTLAAEIATAARPARRIAIADYEPDLGCLGLAVLDVPATGP